MEAQHEAEFVDFVANVSGRLSGRTIKRAHLTPASNPELGTIYWVVMTAGFDRTASIARTVYRGSKPAFRCVGFDCPKAAG